MLPVSEQLTGGDSCGSVGAKLRGLPAYAQGVYFSQLAKTAASCSKVMESCPGTHAVRLPVSCVDNDAARKEDLRYLHTHLLSGFG